MFKVLWGNNLETLAESLFASITQEPFAVAADVLCRKKCLVVPNRIVQGWLQQQFLLTDPPGGAIMANWDFPLLHVFVNDRLDRLVNDQVQPRDPAAHPFGCDALVWRIFNLLQPGNLTDAVYVPLITFLRPDDHMRLEYRRYKLACRLATLYDDYTVYRPDTLLAWEDGRESALPADIAWQPALWRALVAGQLRDKTYLAAFARMARDPQALRQCGVSDEYGHIHVFGVAMMPRVYIHFFQTLAQFINVTFYVLNPSDSDWFTVTQSRTSALEGRPDDNVDFTPDNVFLGQQGRGNRNFLTELLDRTDGQAEAEACFTAIVADSPLHALQAAILHNVATVPVPPAAPIPPACSAVQTHVCHSPLREVEVLHDHLLRWFSESSPPLLPYQVQVQVTDMALYAPYIRAVFTSRNPNAPSAIPYAITDRISTAESSVTAAFLKLLTLGDSRFTSTDVLELLQCRAIADTFDLTDRDTQTVVDWCQRAGIRWGRDATHRKTVTSVDFSAATTWQHGLDRLFLGCAYGDIKPAQKDELPLPCDCVGEDAAPMLGRFAAFATILSEWSLNSARTKPLSKWVEEINALINRLFSATNENYLETNAVRAALTHLEKSAAAAETDTAVALATVRDFLAANLKLATGGDDPGANTVIFSALRPGSSMPRRIICLLGMADKVFPRSDHRPSYDLLRRAPRFGDRSLRQEDRMAFLEAVVNARERLYLSYTGHAAKDNSVIPPAIPLAELHESLTHLGFDSSAFPIILHRLSPDHPLYFAATPEALFSYSTSHFRTSTALAVAAAASSDTPINQGDWHIQPAITHPATTAVPAQVSLNDLTAFFKNPAKSYYTKTLRIRLDPISDKALDENEPFTLSYLERYNINADLSTVLVTEALGHSDPLQALYNQLLDEGRLPLGHYGRQLFDGQCLELRAFLSKPCLKDAAITTLDLLRAWHDAASVTHTLHFGNTALVGQLATPTADIQFRPEFRYASDSTSDRLSAWFRHLFACANGLQYQTIYIRKKKTLVFAPPDTAAQARECLQQLVQCYIDGTTRIIPFIPAVSATFFKSYHSTTASDRETSALTKAREQWLKTGFNDIATEIEDPYFYQAFGDAGPFGDEADFIRVAQLVFDPNPELSN